MERPEALLASEFAAAPMYCEWWQISSAGAPPAQQQGHITLVHERDIYTQSLLQCGLDASVLQAGQSAAVPMCCGWWQIRITGTPPEQVTGRIRDCIDTLSRF